MKVVLNNKADLPNKYVRQMLWRIYQLKDKFNKLHHASIYFQRENKERPEVTLLVKLGTPGKEFTLKQRSENIGRTVNEVYRKSHRLLNKTK